MQRNSHVSEIQIYCFVYFSFIVFYWDELYIQTAYLIYILGVKSVTNNIWQKLRILFSIPFFAKIQIPFTKYQV